MNKAYSMKTYFYNNLQLSYVASVIRMNEDQLFIYFFITLREPISFLFLALHWQVYWHIYCHHDLIEQDKLCRPWQRYQCHHLRSNAEQKGYTFLSSHNLYYTHIQLNANIKRQAFHSGTLIANQVVGFIYIYTEQALIDCTQRCITITALMFGHFEVKAKYLLRNVPKTLDLCLGLMRFLIF